MAGVGKLTEAVASALLGEADLRLDIGSRKGSIRTHPRALLRLEPETEAHQPKKGEKGRIAHIRHVPEHLVG